MAEIVSILDNNFIDVSIPKVESQNSIEDTLQLIKKHEKCGMFYAKTLKDEIDFISSNFYQIEENDEEILKQLKYDTIESIIRNNHLQLKSEDQLINIINQLYSSDSSFSNFYEYVNFLNVSQEKIYEFLSIFDINDITQLTWRTISERLKQKVDQTAESALNSNFKKNGIQVQFDKGKELDGIFNYLRMHSNGNFDSNVKVTSSSVSDTSLTHNNVCIFDNQKVFLSKNEENSWIKFQFNSNRIIPYHYSIKSSAEFRKQYFSYNCNLKSWVIEGSNDDNHWIILDERIDDQSLRNGNVIKTFSMQNWQDKEFKYIRLKQTSKNWYNSQALNINSIEFYGSLI